MADTKISALTQVTTVSSAEEFGVNEGGVSKAILLSQIVTYLQQIGATLSATLPRVFALAASHTATTATGTECAGLTNVLEVGTYKYQYDLIAQAVGNTSGIALGINFTGTAVRHTIIESYPASVSSTTYNAINDIATSAGMVMCQFVQTGFSSTTPNLVNASFVHSNALCPIVIEGIINVTASGSVSLWHASRSTNTTALMDGCSLTVIRTA